MNITDKTSTPRAAVGPAPSSGPSVSGRLLGLALEIPPAAYVALTGSVPLWARIWIGVWLILWLTATVVQATRAQVETR